MDTSTALILIGGVVSALVSFIAYVGRLVASGKWFPAPIVKYKDDEIAWLRARNEELVNQNNLLIKEHATTTTEFLRDFRAAAGGAMR